MRELTTDTYNDWTNRETWAVYLYITNEQGLYSEYVDLINRNTDIREFARELEDWFTATIWDLLEDRGTDYTVRNMILDIGSMWRVNWRELAEADFPND
jgi:hypothetical protein